LFDRILGEKKKKGGKKQMEWRKEKEKLILSHSLSFLDFIHDLYMY